MLLGKGVSPLLRVSSALLPLICLFYIYSLSTQIGIMVYPLVDRVTYYAQFNVYIINEYTDHIVIDTLLFIWLIFSLKKSKVWYSVVGAFFILFLTGIMANYRPVFVGIALASFPIIAALLAYNSYSVKKVLRRQSLDLILNYFGFFGFALGALAFVFVLTTIVSPNLLSSFPIRNYSYDIFLVLSSFSPVMVLLIITALPLRFLIDSITGFRRKNVTGTPQILHQEIQVTDIGKRLTAILLLLIILLSVIVVTIPHISTINNNAQQIGVDTGAYVNWMHNLEKTGSSEEFLHFAFVDASHGDRPLSLILLFVFYKIANVDAFAAIEYVPLVLAPSLVVVVYFLALQLTSRNDTALVAGFLTAVSYHILIGTYAGFYSNWIALIPGYLSLLFLFRFLQSNRSKDLAIFGILNLMILLTHVYTWSIITLVEGICLAFLLIKPKYISQDRRSIVKCLLVISCIVAIDAIRANVTSVAGGIDGDLHLAENLVNAKQFALRWGNLNYTVTTYVGGLFANFLILSLGVVWIIKAKLKSFSTLFLVIFLTIGILPFLIGEYVVQARVFYDIPFQLPAAIALSTSSRNGAWYLRISPIFIWLVALCLGAISNFNLVLPK